MVTMNKQHAISWWFCLGMIAIAAGMLMQHLRLPGGYLIGPLLVAIVAGLIRPDHPALATRILLAAQAVIGMLLATGIQPGIISGIAAYWMPVLLMVCITLGISFIAGIVLARITPLSRETATLGTLPGGATTMIDQYVCQSRHAHGSLNAIHPSCANRRFSGRTSSLYPAHNQYDCAFGTKPFIPSDFARSMDKLPGHRIDYFGWCLVGAEYPPPGGSLAGAFIGWHRNQGNGPIYAVLAARCCEGCIHHCRHVCRIAF